MTIFLISFLFSKGQYIRRDYDLKNTFIFELKETILLRSFLFPKEQHISKRSMILITLLFSKRIFWGVELLVRVKVRDMNIIYR